MTPKNKREVSGMRVGPPPLEETPRFKPVVIPVAKENVFRDLEKYVKVVRDMGAIDVQVVRGKDIPQDVRVYYMCAFPTCRWLNTNSNCPTVRRFPWEEVTELVKGYDHAIVYKVVPPRQNVVSDVGPIKLDMYYTMGGGAAPDEKVLVHNIVRLRKLAEIERKLEQLTYYDGYYSAITVSSGPCLVSCCADTGRCTALEKGGFCKFANTKPTGNTLYIDYHALGRMLDWGEMQPTGNCAFPEDHEGWDYYNIGLTLIV